MSLLQVIDSIGPGRWGFYVRRQTIGLGQVVHPNRHPHEDHLRALESGGASTADLAKALMDAYHKSFPSFISLSQGFRRRDQIHPGNSEMATWALTVFENPWRVLDELGARPLDLLGYLLSRWPPGLWMDDAEELLRVPKHLRAALRTDSLEFGPQEEGLDLDWLPSRIACGLTVQGPIPRVRLPKTLECWGPVHLEGLGGVRALSGITAQGKCLTVIGCQDLEIIDHPANTKLIVKSCYQLSNITGKITADLHVEGCPSLETINVVFPRDAHPAPALTIRRCLRLKTIGQHTSVARTCGALTLEDCPELYYLQNLLTIRGHRIVTNCPALGPVKGGW